MGERSKFSLMITSKIGVDSVQHKQNPNQFQSAKHTQVTGSNKTCPRVISWEFSDIYGLNEECDNSKYG